MGQSQEIVIDHVSGFLSRSFAIVGLLFSLGFLIWFFFADSQEMAPPFDFRFAALCMLVAVASTLSLYSLAADKPYLETSKDGLMVGEFVRWYCPWSNVRNIKVIGVSKRIGRSLSIPNPTVIIPQLVLEFHSPEDLLFDSRLFALLSRLVIKDGRVVLELATRTTMTKEKLCDLLRERWQLAIGENEKSRV